MVSFVKRANPKASAVALSDLIKDNPGAVRLLEQARELFPQYRWGLHTCVECLGSLMLYVNVNIRCAHYMDSLFSEHRNWLDANILSMADQEKQRRNADQRFMPHGPQD